MTPGTRLDTSDLSELGRAAVWYCENGFGIIPIEARGKRPYAPIAPNGLKDWFDNPEDARKVWRMCPDLNIAIVCGECSGGLVVLDFDEDDERSGSDTLADWEDEHGELPYTATAITGRGGMHYLYRTEASVHPSVNHDKATDVRAEGSYIVAPPSVHPNGNRYQWNAGDEPWSRPVARADQNVLNFIDYVQRNGGTAQDAEVPQSSFELPKRIRKGERNDTLFRYGCSLRHRGLPDDAIDAMLRRANEGNCIEPCDESEIATLVKRVCMYGAGHDGQGTMLGDESGVGRPGTSSVVDGDLPPFRGKNGGVLPNVLARIIIDRNHARLIDGAPAVWTGRRWEFGKRAIHRVALEYADDIPKAKKDEVYSYISDKATEVTSDKSFDGGYYVQFADCTWDVLAQRRVEPEPTMLITATLPITLDMDAPYGLADEFIASLADDDEATITVMCEIIGACMCCRRVMSQSPMLIGKADTANGEASNGKSTFIKTIQNLLGSGNYSSLDISTLGQRFQAARIVGKLANLGDDIPNGFLKGDELSIFKKLVTGEQIYTDVKNGEGFEFRPNATMVFSMNSMPRLADTTDGIFRRLQFVPFRRRFVPGAEGFDPDIERKMAADENLRRLAVLGLMALPDLIERRKLTEIPDMVAEVEAVRTDNDVVRRWLFSEYLEPDDFVNQYASDMHARFRDWCKENGENPVIQRTFTRRVLDALAVLHVKETRNRQLGKRGNMFCYGQKHDETEQIDAISDF